jgi:hypothetical protein
MDEHDCPDHYDDETGSGNAREDPGKHGDIIV